MTRTARLLWWTAWLSCAVLCACTIDDARGATARERPATSQRSDAGPALPHSGSDAGATRVVGHEGERHRRDDASEDSLLGLTRAEVKARRGRPTEQHSNEWVYTPPQPGCRDRIRSEVITFKRDVVARVAWRDKQTNKVCGRPPRFEPREEQ